MKPILFNTEMVRAIQADRKTVTRRVVKPQLPYCMMTKAGLITSKNPIKVIDGLIDVTNADVITWAHLPYRPGDILYVRETWRIWRAHRYDADAHIEFKAGGKGTVIRFPHGNTDSANRDAYDRFIDKWGVGCKWHPSIHMPREAARIFLRVTDVRVERLQEIDDNGVVAEGLNIGDPFDELWNSTIKPPDRALYGWEANPWVWVIEFERISREEATGDAMPNDL